MNVHRLTIVVILMLTSACASAQVSPTAKKPIGSEAERPSASRDALRMELEAMLDLDQRGRGKMAKATEAERAQLWSEQRAIDEANQKRLDEIVAQVGWPAIGEFGKKAARAAFLIVQHAPKEMMKRYYDRLKQAADAGEMEKQSFALIEDRLRMYEGRPQLYGSQVRSFGGSQGFEFWQIEDEANVDQRRAAMGLMPLAEYAKLFKELNYVPYAERMRAAEKAKAEKNEKP